MTETSDDMPLFKTQATTSGECALRDGKTLSYEIHGTGSEKIILVMGLLASRYSWRETVDHFMSKDGDKYSVLVYDNRGVGKSSAPWGRYTTGMLAADALDLLNHVGWKEDRSVHLNGVSMGGMISLELALLAAARFRSLTLTSTCAKHQEPPRTRAESAMNWINFFRPKLTAESKVSSLMATLFVDEEWLNSKLPDGRTNRESIFSVMLNRVTKAPPPPLSGQVGQIAACLTHNCSFASLAKISQNLPDILVITGDTDKLIDPKCSEELYRELSVNGERKNVRKVVFRNKGHALMVEAEDEYFREFEATMDAGNLHWNRAQ